MAKSKPPYPPECRTEAIRLAQTSGRSHAAIARELGMTTETLRHWRKQADLDAGRRSDGLTTEEQEELRRLRRGPAPTSSSPRRSWPSTRPVGRPTGRRGSEVAPVWWTINH